MSYSLFHIIHISFLFVLVGTLFAAFAAPQPENRKRCLMWSGISSLVVLVAGLGLMGIMKIGMPPWLWVKLVCWLLLSALAGIAFRKPEKVKQLLMCSLVLIVLAVFMVSVKPF